MAAGFKLPEKEYFSREELADRWKCDLGLVDYYVKEGLLREAIVTKEFDFWEDDFYKVEEDSRLLWSYCFWCRSRGGDGQAHESHDFLKEWQSKGEELDRDQWVIGAPKFAYLGNDGWISGDLPKFQDEVAVSFSRVYFVNYLVDFLNFRFIPISPSFTGEFRPKISDVHLRIDERFNPVIPREERDRFERHIPIGVVVDNADPNLHVESFAEGLSPTKEHGYKVTIGMLAKALGELMPELASSDDVNAKKMAEYLDDSNYGVAGQGADTLRKRIREGIAALKEVT